MRVSRVLPESIGRSRIFERSQQEYNSLDCSETGVFVRFLFWLLSMKMQLKVHVLRLCSKFYSAGRKLIMGALESSEKFRFEITHEK